MKGEAVLRNLFKNPRRFVKKNAPTILTCIGAVGAVVTPILAVKATPKALSLLEEYKQEKEDDLTKLEVIKVAGPVYIPSILVGASTLACIFGANVLNKRQQAALLSAYALLDSSYKDYKKQVEELYGEGANKQVIQEIAKSKYKDEYADLEDNKRLFYDAYSERYFEATIEEVQRAEYRVNRTFALRDEVSVNEFYEMLKIPPIPLGDEIGWSVESCFAFYGFSWIDFDHEKVELEDGLECYIIRMAYEPVIDFYNY